MENRLKTSIRPIVTIERDDVYALCDLAKRANSEDSSESAIKISAELRDSQEYRTNDVEKIFEIPNISTNAIAKITIESESYRPNHIKIVVGGQKYNDFGAELQVHGNPDFVRSVRSEFERILKKEKAFIEIFASLNSFYWAVIAIHFLIALAYFSLSSFSDRDLSLKDMMISYVMIFLGSIMLFNSIASDVQYRYFGRAAYLWGDGARRYQKSLKVLNFVMWTVPITVLLGYLTNKL